MMTPIQTNKPVFFGDNGEVLKSGYIYIGQPNQDPRTAPKTVTFKDSAGGLFTAAQPLRTNAQGQIAYNGKAIIALVDGNYSMLIQNSNQVQVKDGFTPIIENTEAGGGSGDGILYGLTLSDVKATDLFPGDVIESIGKINATDNLGARWLVVSNTGNPADDLTLIDFTNGTQGVRIYKSEKELIASPGTDTYDMSGLPAGFYYIDTFGSSYATIYWDGVNDTSVSFDSDGSPTFFAIGRLEIIGSILASRFTFIDLDGPESEDTARTITAVYRIGN